MNTFYLHYIPCVLWGNPSDKIILAVHGNLSSKTDVPIQILAKVASAKGYQVLSFDLPEHGDRKEEATLCKVQTCVQELQQIINYTSVHWKNVSLFANSIGAYFSLTALQNISLQRALFLSPVLNMLEIIQGMMAAFGISEEQLYQEQTISTPIGQTLYWDYYCYVKEHPVSPWNTPTWILSGGKDTLCNPQTFQSFVEQYHCTLTLSPESEHYFHTEHDLSVLENWFKVCI